MAARRSQLEAQQNRCIYCGIQFGENAVRDGKTVALGIVWDHFVPYLYTQNNGPANFVASCQVCNQIKAAFSFHTMEEARVYVLMQREARGYL